MTKVDSIEALAEAARHVGLNADPNVLYAVVTRAYAPHETMTAAERQFLLASGAPSNSFNPGRQAEARARLVARAAEASRQTAPRLSTREVAELLDRDPANVRRSVGVGDLYAISEGPQRELSFPSWQFVEGRPLRGLREVVSALPGSIHPLSLEAWVTSPEEELDDRTPVQWLSTGGDVSVVVWLADSYARR